MRESSVFMPLLQRKKVILNAFRNFLSRKKLWIKLLSLQHLHTVHQVLFIKLPTLLWQLPNIIKNADKTRLLFLMIFQPMRSFTGSFRFSPDAFPDVIRTQEIFLIFIPNDSNAR